MLNNLCIFKNVYAIHLKSLGRNKEYIIFSKMSTVFEQNYQTNKHLVTIDKLNEVYNEKPLKCH